MITLSQIPAALLLVIIVGLIFIGMAISIVIEWRKEIRTRAVDVADKVENVKIDLESYKKETNIRWDNQDQRMSEASEDMKVIKDALITH